MVAKRKTKTAVVAEPISITVENCGRFFDDYVVQRGGTLLGIYATVAKIPREYVTEWFGALRKSLRLTPNGAAALLGIAEEAFNAAES